MTNAEVEVGRLYVAKVSGRLSIVRIKCPRIFTKGWTGINCATGRFVFIRSGQRLRRSIQEEELQKWLMKVN